MASDAEAGATPGPGPVAAENRGGDELAELKAQLAAMQQKIEKLTDGKE